MIFCDFWLQKSEVLGPLLLLEVPHFLLAYLVLEFICSAVLGGDFRSSIAVRRLCCYCY